MAACSAHGVPVRVIHWPEEGRGKQLSIHLMKVYYMNNAITSRHCLVAQSSTDPKIHLPNYFQFFDAPAVPPPPPPTVAPPPLRLYFLGSTNQTIVSHPATYMPPCLSKEFSSKHDLSSRLSPRKKRGFIDRDTTKRINVPFLLIFALSLVPLPPSQKPLPAFPTRTV